MYAVHKDTAAFVEWSYDSEMGRGYVLYPLFLRTCRGLFGETAYLQAVNIIQSLLALVSSVMLAEYVRKEYKLAFFSGFLSFVAICGVYGYSLPEMVASHYIVTESLTFPLFSLMVFFILKYINERSIISIVFVFGLLCVMTSIRPQMAFFIPMVLFLLVINKISLAVGRSKWTSIVAIPVLVIAIFVGLFIVTVITVHLFTGRANSQYHEAVVGKVMCVMKPNDIVLHDDSLKEGYELLYEDTRNNGGLTENFPSSMLDYEKIQTIIDDNMKQGLNVIWEWYDTTYEKVDRQGIHEIRNRIIATELNAHKMEFIGVILRLMPSSLVSSIFIQPSQYRLVCNIVAFMLYFAAIILVYVAYYMSIDRRYYMPMVICLIMIVGNSLLSNIVLYGQQRYVVYCFGIFYISLLLLVSGIRKSFQVKEKSLC